MGLQTHYGRPVAWGILTPDTQEQALDRSGLKFGNKGLEAALAAIETLSVIDQL
jgi:6,7-dimethyl-8-ribityllumazine synthase